VLAHAILNERLNLFGLLGCGLCITGSLTIVMHAPPEQPIHSVSEVWNLAAQPGEGRGGGGCMAGKTANVIAFVALTQLRRVLPHTVPAAFMSYALAATACIVYLVWGVAPSHGSSNLFVYLAICSLAGSLSVVSCKVGTICWSAACYVGTCLRHVVCECEYILWHVLRSEFTACECARAYLHVGV
jgi:hypothetical protein